MFFSFIAGAPYIMINVLGQSSLDYGLWFMLASVGYMTGNFLSGRYSQTIGIDRMMTAGNVLAMCGTAAMVTFAVTGYLSSASLFGAMLLVTLGNGLTIPNGTAAAISVLPKSIGAAAGLSGFAQVAIGACASQFTGSMQQTVPLIALWVMLVSAALALVSHQVNSRL
jgi:DHA1 family bicyclomycin/chloramphenicol resistance-like MFS transporter